MNTDTQLDLTTKPRELDVLGSQLGDTLAELHRLGGRVESLAVVAKHNALWRLRIHWPCSCELCQPELT